MRKVFLEERRSGKTTGELLKVLGEAVANPGKEIEYKDHTLELGASKKEINKRCADTLKRFISTLGIEAKVICDNNSYNLYVKSTWSPIYFGSDGNTYKKIS